MTTPTTEPHPIDVYRQTVDPSEVHRQRPDRRADRALKPPVACNVRSGHAQAKLSAAQKRFNYLVKRSGIDVSALQVSEAQLTITNLQVDLDIATAELEALQAPI